eukprot:1192499-Pleurochrysis_carterae.AAC.1
MPSTGSSTSPVPVSVSDTLASATIMIASSRRKYLSIRHACRAEQRKQRSVPWCANALPSRKQLLSSDGV